MGCASSKVDDLPAVALCRERCDFLEQAIRLRYSLADAHVAYMLSLKGVGGSLRRFFDQNLEPVMAAPPSPVLNLPPQRKGQPGPSGSSPSEVIHHRHSHSNSGSHLHLDSDPDFDSDESGSETLHHDDDHYHYHPHHLSGKNSPNHPYGQMNYADQESLSSYPLGYMNPNFNISYTKSKAAPSVVYAQKPMVPETVYMGESSSSSYYHYPYDSNQNQNPSSYPYYSNSGNGNFFAGPSYGYSSTPAATGPIGSMHSEASTSRSAPAPPPPPPQPQTSAWDFLNPFDSVDNYPLYTSSRDSGDVRDIEGIPDLEDEEDFQHEVVKEVHEDKKFVDGGGGNSYSKGVGNDANENMRASDSMYHARPSNLAENDHPVEYEVHVVDKKVDKEEISGQRGNTPAFNVRLSSDSEIVREIEAQFQRASDSGNDLTGLLEVGKKPYKKGAGYNVTSKLLHVTTPSVLVLQPSTSKNAEASSIDNDGPEIEEVVGMGSGNLSSTLHKLFLWEKKLYNEVKVEEKMRILHDKKSAKLVRMDKRGAEAHKIEATRMFIKNLSTKIRIAIQIVDKISVKINKLRDEELWPQLNELIQGLAKFWKSLVECHRGQCQAIGQARKLDMIASRKQHPTDALLEVTLQLEYELLNWISKFSFWIGSQKGFVKELNNWLMKCLLYEPEETADGIVPFSPGRIGAPPIFVMCFQWAQAMERISEKEVVDSMRECARSVLQLWERDVLEMRNRMVANKDLERRFKSLEKEERKVQKEIQALDKRLVLLSADGNGSLSTLSGHLVYQGDTNKSSSSLQTSLKRAFETMERFTSESLSAYEELLLRIEEDRQHRAGKENDEIAQNPNG